MTEKKWLVSDSADFDQEQLDRLKIGPILWQLLYNRGISNDKEILDFLSIDVDEQILDPFSLDGMDSAVNLLIKHLKEKNKVCIYGDYDADGVTSSAVLFLLLKLFKTQVEVYIPDRKKDGYGVNAKSIKYLSDSGVKLIITVDCGIRNKEEFELAKKSGIDVIVTDHHLPGDNQEDWPDTIILNPMLPDSNYRFKRLAGVGVAAKLAQALISKSSLSDSDRFSLTNNLWDLVAIGTIADMVPLLGENRAIVKKGLKLINEKKIFGIESLLNVSKIDKNKEIDSWNVSFQLAPRLNAAGRLDSANTAFALLVSQDKNESDKLAQGLNQKNYLRQQITSEIVESAEKQVDNQNLEEILVLASPDTEDWEIGVVGLVAGRLCEKYYRPVLLMSKTDNIYKGSGRSTPDFNIMKALEECSDILLKYGGHAQACGFSLDSDKKDVFKKKMEDIARQELKGKDLRPTIKIDLEINLGDISEEFYGQIKKMEPFGQDNPRPVFVSREIEILDISCIGAEGQHLKMRVRQGESNFFDILAFGKSDIWGGFSIDDKIDLVYNIDLNIFNGRRNLQLMAIDIKKNEN